MWYFKTELEQHCFALSQPDEYFEVAADLERVRAEHAEILDQTALAVRTALLADPVLARHLDWIRVQARTKAAYSAWQKMQRKTQARDAPRPLLPAPSSLPRRLRRALSPASPRRRSTT